MNNFNDRIYLLLTFKNSELKEYYFKTMVPLVAIAIYNLVGVAMDLPRAIDYSAILVAAIMVTLFFWYIKANTLPVDWELLVALKEQTTVEDVEEKEREDEVQEKQPEGEEQPIKSNDEIEKVEVEEDKFDFADSLISLYKTGTPKQMADAVVNSAATKVRRMNI